jgi:hypothetical protein
MGEGLAPAGADWHDPGNANRRRLSLRKGQSIEAFSPSSMTARACLLPCLILSAGWLFAAAPTLNAADESAPARLVEVRSTVDNLWTGARKKAPQPHGKLYYIVSATLSESEENLVRPVDEGALVRQLKQALHAHGFREITETEKPDILLGIVYGRGFLKNPYLGEVVDEISPGLSTTSVTSSRQVMAQREAGYESKVQRAQTEKLFLTVRALKYPEKPREKPTRLWQTTMILENPERHDLNEVASDMFRAGAPHFDRMLPKEGIVVSTADPSRPVPLR